MLLFIDTYVSAHSVAPVYFLHQAIIHARARQSKSESSKVVNTGDEDDTQVNLASERAKYKSFWVGVNRGITLASKNPKILDDEIKKIDINEGVRINVV